MSSPYPDRSSTLRFPRHVPYECIKAFSINALSSLSESLFMKLVISAGSQPGQEEAQKEGTNWQDSVEASCTQLLSSAEHVP